MSTIQLFDYGLLFPKEKRLKISSTGRGVTGCVRGSIDSFSYASRLRLRMALLRYRLPSGVRVGITLTLPWVVSDWPKVMVDFREVLHRFRVYWLRRFPDCGSIYRVELQKRGAPHLHMVSWHRLPLPPDLVDIYFSLWFDSMLHDLRGGSYSDFARRGVVVDTLPNVIASIRYLCDHASKRKQAQLGYRGKQWGIYGKSNLVQFCGLPLDFTEREFVLLKRFLRRVTRFRVDSDCVFGSRLSRLRSLNRVVYVSDNAIKKFCDFLSSGVDYTHKLCYTFDR